MRLLRLSEPAADTAVRALRRMLSATLSPCCYAERRVTPSPEMFKPGVPNKRPGCCYHLQSPCLLARQAGRRGLRGQEVLTPAGRKTKPYLSDRHRLSCSGLHRGLQPPAVPLSHQEKCRASPATWQRPPQGLGTEHTAHRCIQTELPPPQAAAPACLPRLSAAKPSLETLIVCKVACQS